MSKISVSKISRRLEVVETERTILTARRLTAGLLYTRRSTTLSRRTLLTKSTGKNLDHSAQNSTVVYETQLQYAKLKHCMRYFRP